MNSSPENAHSKSLMCLTDDAHLQKRVTVACEGLRANLRVLPGESSPVLIEGAEYNGIWLECGPHEALIAAELGVLPLETALASHRIFIAHQAHDGLFPAYIWANKTGFGQMQCVVPWIQTALKTFELGGDLDFLATAYEAWQRYDSWFEKFRDTRKTGLVEAFCEWDTGHDNSPRFHEHPRECPNGDTRLCPPNTNAPLLAPDLSATKYGGRLALSRAARRLGYEAQAQEWAAKAEETRRALLAWCFDVETLGFYDVNRWGKWNRVLGDATLRVLGEGVVDQSLFDAIDARHLEDPAAFNTPFPHPAIAANDALFDHELKHNSWGGPSQALQAMRAPGWMIPYGREAALAHLLRRWVEALRRASEFRQQLHPWTGEQLAGATNYSPAMLVLLEGCARLYGIKREGNRLLWGGELPPDATWCQWRLNTAQGEAVLRHEGPLTTAYLGEQLIFEAKSKQPFRFETDSQGRLLEVISTSREPVSMRYTVPATAPVETTLSPNQRHLWA